MHNIYASKKEIIQKKKMGTCFFKRLNISKTYQPINVIHLAWHRKEKEEKRGHYPFLKGRTFPKHFNQLINLI